MVYNSTVAKCGKKEHRDLKHFLPLKTTLDVLAHDFFFNY